MNLVRSMARPVSCLVIAGVLSWSLPTAPAQAALVSSDSAIAEGQAAASRAQVNQFMQRQDVQAQMQALGIDPAEAAARVEGLTDAEVAQIAGKLDEMPAGAGVLETVLIVGLVVFVVLLITDIVGATNIFPFTRSVR